MKKVRYSFLCTSLLIAIVAVSTACRKGASTDGVNSPQASQASGTGSPQSQSAANSSNDAGDLKLRYQSRKNVRAAADHKVGSNPQAIEKVMAELNQQLALPFDLYVSFEDCDGPDAFYDKETHQVTLCYQLIDEYYSIFSRKIKDKGKLDEAVRGAMASTFFHELGHALIDALSLPATGKEEDAADQLSTLVLINRTENGEQMALDGALSFKLYADLEKGEQKIYWDEHSLDDQRFYDTLCLIYGHDPEKYAYLIKDGTLPEERAEMCTEDYKKLVRAWQQLLLPHLKDGRPLSKLGQK